MKAFKTFFSILTISLAAESSGLPCIENKDGSITKCEHHTCKLFKSIESNKFKDCDGCGNLFRSFQLKACSNCKNASYCSPDCQKIDWRQSHKKGCHRIGLPVDTTDLDRDALAISAAASKKPIISEDHQLFLDELLMLPLDSILDPDLGEPICKAIGQRAFDFFKELKFGNSLSAFRDLQSIVNSVHFSEPDGQLRMPLIEKAFEDVGDEVKRWAP